MYCSVPARGQGQVDDHVHRDQISHCIVVGSHGAQDALSGLITGQHPKKTFLCVQGALIFRSICFYTYSYEDAARPVEVVDPTLRGENTENS